MSSCSDKTIDPAITVALQCATIQMMAERQNANDENTTVDHKAVVVVAVVVSEKKMRKRKRK